MASSSTAALSATATGPSLAPVTVMLSDAPLAAPWASVTV